MAATIFTAKKTRNDPIAWLKQASTGKVVRIRFGKALYELHAAGSASQTYAEAEYRVTRKDLKSFAQRMDAKIEKDRKTGRSKKYTGNIEALL